LLHTAYGRTQHLAVGSTDGPLSDLLSHGTIRRLVLSHVWQPVGADPLCLG
jgi:hypothetical protein